MATVKAGRRYDSSGRRRQAEQTRASILACARELFSSAGYAATTVPAVAQRAGVSVETVYKSIGPKTALVRALWEQGLAGTGAVPAEHRSDEASATAPDAGAIIRGWGELIREVAPRTAPISLLMRDAAATDPDMADLLADTERLRRERMRHNATMLQRTGGLKPGVGLDRVTDVLWLYSAAELYELLVIKSGWEIDDFCSFVVESMVSSLLG